MIKVTWSFISSSRAATKIRIFEGLPSEGATEILTSISSPVRKFFALSQKPGNTRDSATASGLTYGDCIC
ncbi:MULTISPECIES: hypothetical protein [unclassified Bartonella]|uniref:hypothetical protein n=1 Tax=unclassified Bartonella TaxID=2645622 RepID=UPI0035CF0006